LNILSKCQVKKYGMKLGGDGFKIYVFCAKPVIEYHIRILYQDIWKPKGTAIMGGIAL
jgi:hypothetical protein